MRALALLPVVAALVVGCGPSLRRIHLAEAYFERCYAGDRDALATDVERHDCWRAWLEHYAEGQAIERVDYAEERVITLDPDRRAILAIALTEDVDEAPSFETAVVETPVLEASVVETPAPIVEAPVTEAPITHDAVDPPATTELDRARDAEAALEAERAARAAELHRRHRPIAPTTSAPRCAAACEPAWVTCVDACAEGEDACVRACRLSYRTCSRGCY